MNTVSVLIRHHAGPTGDVLICKNEEGVWEFPYGKVHVSETDAEAVERIAWETLGLRAKAGILAMVGHKDPSDGVVEHLAVGNITHNTNTKCDWHCYYEAVNIWQAEPKCGKYSEFRWVHPSELGGVCFDGDDKQFMAKYDPWINGRSIPDVRMP